MVDEFPPILMAKLSYSSKAWTSLSTKTTPKNILSFIHIFEWANSIQFKQTIFLKFTHKASFSFERIITVVGMIIGCEWFLQPRKVIFESWKKENGLVIITFTQEITLCWTNNTKKDCLPICCCDEDIFLFPFPFLSWVLKNRKSFPYCYRNLVHSSGNRTPHLRGNQESCWLVDGTTQDTPPTQQLFLFAFLILRY